MKHIKLVGTELEGGWSHPFLDEKTLSIQEDVSVQNSASHPLKPGKGGKAIKHWGELPSPPLPLEEAVKWMWNHYPESVNETCGFHVHVSVDSVDNYSRLMSKRFYDRFLNEAEKFGKSLKLPAKHPFWYRLEGDPKHQFARFCQKGWYPMEQTVIKGKHDSDHANKIRRTHINFPFLQHGTIECRLFPAWETADLAEASVRWFVELIDDYLNEAPKVLSRFVIVRASKLRTLKVRKPERWDED